MTTKLRQVSKEEFEILTKFHPGEVRYYVDVGKALNTRHKGAKVSVKRKPQATKAKARKKAATKKAVAARKPAINAMSGRVQNAPLQLTAKQVEFKEGSKSENMYRLVRHQFRSDPTAVIGRSDLAKNIIDTSVYTANQINPHISDLIKAGALRYRKDESSQKTA